LNAEKKTAPSLSPHRTARPPIHVDALAFVSEPFAYVARLRTFEIVAQHCLHVATLSADIALPQSNPVAECMEAHLKCAKIVGAYFSRELDDEAIRIAPDDDRG
jgi:hypothetical protein